MKKVFLILIFIITNGICSGQTNASKLTSKISSYFNIHSVVVKNQIYLNSKELILDINDFQIPLNNVTIKYESDPRTVNGLKREGLVVFECQKDCIFNKGEYILSVGYAFKNKKGAYDTIELINELIKELEK